MPGKTLVVTSGKGGVGKTTTTANVGTALALKGRRVVMLDIDIGLRNLDVVLGLENRIVYDIVHVVEGKCRLAQAMIRDRSLENLYFIPAAQTRDKSAVQPEQLQQVCDELKKEFDYVIIDCPAGIEHGFQTALAPADQVILVTTPEVSAVRDADRVIGLVEARSLPAPLLVLNRVRVDMVKRGEMMSTDDILSLLSVKLLGIVPDNEDVVIATNRGMPVARDPMSSVGKAFRNIASRLDGEDVPVLALETRSPGFFSWLSDVLGMKPREAPNA